MLVIVIVKPRMPDEEIRFSGASDVHITVVTGLDWLRGRCNANLAPTGAERRQTGMVGGKPELTPTVRNDALAVSEHMEKEVSGQISPNDHELRNADLEYNGFRHGEVVWQGPFENADLQLGDLLPEPASTTG